MVLIYVRGEQDSWEFRRDPAGNLELSRVCGIDEQPASLNLVRTLGVDPDLETGSAFWTAWGKVPLTGAEVWAGPAETVLVSGPDRAFLSTAPALKAALERKDSLHLAGIIEQFRLAGSPGRPLFRSLVQPLAAEALVSGAWGSWGRTGPELQGPQEDRTAPQILDEALRASGLTVPLAGHSLGDWTDAVLTPAWNAYRKGVEGCFFDFSGRKALESQVHTWFSGLRVEIQPEPWNRHDPLAQKVVITDGTGVPRKAGYLPRSVAALWSQAGSGDFPLRAVMVRCHGPTRATPDPKVVLRLQT